MTTNEQKHEHLSCILLILTRRTRLVVINKTQYALLTPSKSDGRLYFFFHSLSYLFIFFFFLVVKLLHNVSCFLFLYWCCCFFFDKWSDTLIGHPFFYFWKRFFFSILHPLFFIYFHLCWTTWSLQFIQIIRRHFFFRLLFRNFFSFLRV